MLNKLIDKLNVLEPLIDKINKEELTAKYTFLCNRVMHPDFFAAFLGETSSGKSSVINGLLGSSVLPVAARPTTGVVTEIDINCEDENMYALFKNATMEKIDKDKFDHICRESCNNLSRLIAHRTVKYSNLKGVRLFDTPGYGSLVDEHEEILKAFLPSSDIVIYLVNYRVGIQNDDYLFMKSIKELLRDDVEIVLAVNMCPQGMTSDDRRFKEITEHAYHTIGIRPKLFTIERIIQDKNANTPALPKSEALWNYISGVLNSEEHIKRLYDSFDSFIKELYEECLSEVTIRYESSKMDSDSAEQFKKSQEEWASSIEQAIPNLIRPRFKKIMDNTSSKFDIVVNNASKTIKGEVEKSSVGNKEDMVNFVNAHLLPHNIHKESKNNIDFYFETELESLNQEVSDLINKETINFNNKIKIALDDPIGNNPANKMAVEYMKKLTNSGLNSYFSTFGGAAGAGGGVANAASHALKKLGDVFNHTFSRSTHNGLKHFLAKMGATSAKSIAIAAAIIIDIVIDLIDLATWKMRLKSKIDEGLKKWKDNCYPKTIKSLEDLQVENENNLRVIVEKIRTSISDLPQSNTEDLYDDVVLAQKIGEQLKK